ncbi:MAG: methylenetetrahydrofolate reductase [Actinomycetota bacterium]
MSFRVIFELAPPREPNLRKVLRQIEVFAPIVHAFLVPDNHLGQPAISSLAIALEVQARGFSPIVALNARDRNRLRLRSDLLTLRAYGVQEVLFLYGDPVEGQRCGLTVRQMLNDDAGDGLRRGAVATIGKPLGWRAAADFLVTRLDLAGPPADFHPVSGSGVRPIYCGTLALAGAEIARKVLANLPNLAPPPGYLEAFDHDDEAGFHAALESLDHLRRSGIDGAHLVVPARRRRFARLLESWMADRNLLEGGSGAAAGERYDLLRHRGPGSPAEH